MALATMAIISFWPMTDVEARPRRPGVVVACSQHGHGCIRGEVRNGPVGPEVRMPGGTWIGCKQNCRRTLREEALDFFETLNDRVWDN
jgi:hypothetical protein